MVGGAGGQQWVRLGVAHKPLYVVPKGRYLLVVPGNIDLLARPAVHNPDGTISSTYSYTFTLEDPPYKGFFILLPGVIRDARGKWITSHSKSQVFNAYRRTRQFFGIFRTNSAAERYAELLHEQQAALPGKGG